VTEIEGSLIPDYPLAALFQTLRWDIENEAPRGGGRVVQILQKKRPLRHAHPFGVPEDQRWLRVVYASKF
jgi:hypothetical protein